MQGCTASSVAWAKPGWALVVDAKGGRWLVSGADKREAYDEETGTRRVWFNPIYGRWGGSPCLPSASFENPAFVVYGGHVYADTNTSVDVFSIEPYKEE